MYWWLTQRHIRTSLKSRGQVGARRQEETHSLQRPIEVDPRIPAALSSLIMDCIQRNPERRPLSMGDVLLRLDVANRQARRSLGS